MDQSLALNALAPYLALAKSATSPRAAADLITQATSAANTYVFAELLQHPNIQALQENPEYRSHYTLLAIFSWGTWETYNQTPDLPALSDAQLLKLRLLSLLTIASDRHATPTSTPRSSNLSYSSLCVLLGLATPLDLEHLITQAIYSNLLTATLNPASQTVHITAVSPLRDLAPGSVGVMTTELEAWSLRCQSVLATLDAEIAKVRGAAARRAMREQKADKQIKAVVDSAEGNDKVGGTLAAIKSGANTRGRRDIAPEDDDGMDVDGLEGGGRGGATGKLKGPSGR